MAFREMTTLKLSGLIPCKRNISSLFILRFLLRIQWPLNRLRVMQGEKSLVNREFRVEASQSTMYCSLVGEWPNCCMRDIALCKFVWTVRLRSFGTCGFVVLGSPSRKSSMLGVFVGLGNLNELFLPENVSLRMPTQYHRGLLWGIP